MSTAPLVIEASVPPFTPSEPFNRSTALQTAKNDSHISLFQAAGYSRSQFKQAWALSNVEKIVIFNGDKPADQDISLQTDVSSHQSSTSHEQAHDDEYARYLERFHGLELGLASISSEERIDQLLTALESSDQTKIAALSYSIQKIVVLSYNHFPPQLWTGRIKTCPQTLRSTLHWLRQMDFENIWIDQIFSARNGWNTPGWTTSALRPYLTWPVHYLEVQSATPILQSQPSRSISSHYYVSPQGILPTPRYVSSPSERVNNDLDSRIPPLLRAAILQAQHRGLLVLDQPFHVVPSAVRMSRLWTSVEALAAMAGQGFVQTHEQAVIESIIHGGLQWLRVAMLAKAAIQSQLVGCGYGQPLGHKRRIVGTSYGMEDQLSVYFQGHYMLFYELPTSIRRGNSDAFFAFVAASVSLGALKDRTCFAERDRRMMALPILTGDIADLERAEAPGAKIRLANVNLRSIVAAHRLVFSSKASDGYVTPGSEYQQASFFDNFNHTWLPSNIEIHQKHPQFIGLLQPWRSVLLQFLTEDSLNAVMNTWKLERKSMVLAYGVSRLGNAGFSFHKQAISGEQDQFLYQLTFLHYAVNESGRGRLIKYRCFPVDTDLAAVERKPLQWLGACGAAVAATSPRHYEALMNIAPLDVVQKVDLAGVGWLEGLHPNTPTVGCSVDYIVLGNI